MGIGYYGISEAELSEKLKGFNKKCHDEGYIDGDVFLDEAYPGVIPTSFIVNLWVKKQQLDQTSRGKVLDLFIDALWKTTTPEIRQNIFTLSMLVFEDLTPDKIKELFYHRNNSVRLKLINIIKTGTLSEQQIHRIFETNDNNIIKLLSENEKAQKVAFGSKELKFKWLQWMI